MKRILYGIMVWTVLAMPVVSQEQDSTGNVHVFLGRKFLSDWEPAEDHYEFGILVDLKPRGWPFSIASDCLYSTGDGTEFDLVKGAHIDVEGVTTEWNVGFRKIWDQYTNVRP